MYLLRCSFSINVREESYVIYTRYGDKVRYSRPESASHVCIHILRSMPVIEGKFEPCKSASSSCCRPHKPAQSGAATELLMNIRVVTRENRVSLHTWFHANRKDSNAPPAFHVCRLGTLMFGSPIRHKVYSGPSVRPRPQEWYMHTQSDGNQHSGLWSGYTVLCFSRARACGSCLNLSDGNLSVSIANHNQLCISRQKI